MAAKSEVLAVLAEREFAEADQEWFAAVSGDRNPMHVDRVAARRTLAGRPVVHGVHTLVWALDRLCAQLPELRPIASIEVQFERMVYVGDHARAVLVVRDRQPTIVRVIVDDAVAMTVRVAPGQAALSEPDLPDGPSLDPPDPLDLTVAEMVECRGSVPLRPSAADLERAFPSAAAALGGQALAGLACSSFIVGMVCPGLHSLYDSLKLAPTSHQASDAMRFRVETWDPRFRLLRLSVGGGGWVGSIDARARPEPTPQASLSTISSVVSSREFEGASALVVGGSRGLGELVAKILAAGGAEVSVTYALGEADARRVQAEIASFGGRCDVFRYDVQSDPREQLDQLKSHPNQLYYMATTKIFQRKARVFSQSLFEEFLTFYVSGFYDLCRELRTRSGEDISIFYPSSVAVEERPANMTEYAMAKAAGEVLCRDMLKYERPGQVLVQRLPRLPTDQTAVLIPTEACDPLETMLPIVRAVHAAGRSPIPIQGQVRTG